MNMSDVKVVTLKQGEVDTVVKEISSGGATLWQYTPGWYTIFEGSESVTAIIGSQHKEIDCEIYDTGSQQFRVTFAFSLTGTGEP